jgi:hypothetical protein
MLTIIRASLLGSALMLLQGCTGYLTNYQTPCVPGHELSPNFGDGRDQAAAA